MSFDPPMDPADDIERRLAAQRETQRQQKFEQLELPLTYPSKKGKECKRT